MKVVGQFRNNNIYVDNLHIKRTYGDFLGLNGSWLEGANRFLFECIPEDFAQYNPRELPIVIVKGKDFKADKSLPRIMVIGEFYCDAGCREEYEESSLMVVWFQERDQDFFLKAEEAVQQVNWEKSAKNFRLKNEFHG